MTTRRSFAVGLAASLMGCGRRPPVVTDAAAVPAVITRRAFGDADPHDWAGPGPAALPVHGIDVSRWQAQVDWPAARAAGANFAFVKATEGGDALSPGFAAQWQESARAGMPRGAYHVFYFCTPAEVQARWFIRNVPRQAGALPPVLDLEWNPASPTCRLRPPPDVVRREAAIFSRIVAAHYGQRPILYITADFYDHNQMIRMDREEFWLRSVAAHPAERFPGAGWSFWQYSGTGQVPGIAGRVDLNAFNGSATDWLRWLAARRQPA